MSQYSNTLRKKVLDEVQKADEMGRYSGNENRLTRQQIADKFNIGICTIKSWINLKKQSKIEENPSLWKTKKVKLRGSKVLDLEKLEKFVKENSDMYLAEIAQKFNSNDSTIGYWLRKMGFNRKKNRKRTKKLTLKKAQ